MTNTNDMDGLDGAKVRALRDTAAKGGDWRTVELCDIPAAKLFGLKLKGL